MLTVRRCGAAQLERLFRDFTGPVLFRGQA
jgi:hypothetical protein